MNIKMDNKIEEKHWEGIKETTGMTKEQFQKLLTLEEEIRQFLTEMEECITASRRVQSNLNFDPYLFMLWRMAKR